MQDGQQGVCDGRFLGICLALLDVVAQLVTGHCQTLTRTPVAQQGTGRAEHGVDDGSIDRVSQQIVVLAGPLGGRRQVLPGGDEHGGRDCRSGHDGDLLFLDQL
ncbi:hypothetical protein OHA25_60460 (plasmid) [Nonomuraea sp. NBC_00507]|uniref:hypothetical protein n=1 Tax=Nonomuraea sp. NBC_00507 TaxID=2976002 RepID=UPI002E16D4E7